MHPGIEEDGTQQAPGGTSSDRGGCSKYYKTSSLIEADAQSSIKHRSLLEVDARSIIKIVV